MPATVFPTSIDTVAGLRPLDPTTVDESQMMDNVVGAVIALETLTQAAVVGAGAAAGYKLARGVHQQAAASDTIVTGLATVVAVVVSWRDAPTVKQLFCNGSIGNQAGAPAAGSILTRTYKPTAVNDVTPLAATDFTDNLSLNWIAIGT